MEAYNHWLLTKGNEDGFAKWQSDYKAMRENFVNRFSENKLQVDRLHKFYRAQY